MQAQTPGHTPTEGPDTVPAAALQARQPVYAYCEIIGSHLPSLSGEVIFDFGQPTSALRYNKLTNERGRIYTFISMVEALNFMVRQGWELVLTYRAGEDNQFVHHQFRKPVSQLTDEQREIWEAEPATK